MFSDGVTSVNGHDRSSALLRHPAGRSHKGDIQDDTLLTIMEGAQPPLEMKVLFHAYDRAGYYRESLRLSDAASVPVRVPAGHLPELRCRRTRRCLRHRGLLCQRSFGQTFALVSVFNGATADTRRSVQDAVARYSHPELRFRCIESRPGKIAAHRQIAAERRLQGHLLFVDADLGYERETFLRLYRRLTATPRLWACHAEVLASASVARGWFAAAQNAYYRCSYRSAVRTHLHGRCFILREWLPELEAMRSAMATDRMEEPGPLRLELGPIVDDIHYSRVIATCFGHDAIGCDHDAAVRFVPPHSWRELYKDSCRTEIELARLDALFPAP